MVGKSTEKSKEFWNMFLEEHDPLNQQLLKLHKESGKSKSAFIKDLIEKALAPSTVEQPSKQSSEPIKEK